MHDDESSHMLTVKGTQKLFRKQYSVSNLIGAPYGSIFEVDSNKMTLNPASESEAIDLNTEVTIGEPSACEGSSSKEDKQEKDSMGLIKDNKGDNRLYVYMSVCVYV